MSKVVYISQPMHGFTQDEIDERRRKAVEYLEGLGYIVVNPMAVIVTEDAAPESVLNPGVYALSQSIRELSCADVAYFLIGWNQYKGCEIEHVVARQYGVTCVYEVNDNV